MKKITRWMSDIFSPKQLQDLDAMDILDALGDPVVRKTWLYNVFDTLKHLNLDIDNRLQNGGFRIEDLCARRKAYQNILEEVISAKRSVTMARNTNQPLKVGEFDLNSVTVQPSPK